MECTVQTVTVKGLDFLYYPRSSKAVLKVLC
jgi:hypothetical protein